LKEGFILGVFFQRKYKSLKRSLLPAASLACKSGLCQKITRVWDENLLKEGLILGVFFQRKYKSLNRSLPEASLAYNRIMLKYNQGLRQKDIERGFVYMYL
jgi:hypothetical protein